MVCTLCMVIFGVYDTVLRNFLPGLLPRLDFGKSCLQLVVCTAVATGIAYLSRVTYEEFFLRVKDKTTRAEENKGAVVAA